MNAIAGNSFLENQLKNSFSNWRLKISKMEEVWIK